MPKALSSVFTDGNIHFSGITLLPHHISSLIYFMSASSMQQWRILNLGNCNLGNIGMNSLLEHTIKNEESISSMLEYVDLSGNNSSPWGVYCVMIRCCTLKTLILCGDEGMEEYIKEIKDSLQENEILQSLTLCKIGRSGIQSIECILVDNTTLLELNLSWGSSAEGTKILNRQFKVKSHYNDRVVNINILYDDFHDYLSKSINLSKRNISDDELYLIIFGLYNNTVVKILDLSHNNISINGLNKLSECVKHTTSLEYVDLCGNRSSPWYAYCSIIKHCCVNCLTLCGDTGMKQFVKEITDSLQSNPTLQTLSLCKIGAIGLQAIRDALDNNTTLKELNISLKAKGTKIIHRKATNNRFSNMRFALNAAESVMDINVSYDGDHKCSSTAINMSNRGINYDQLVLITFGLYNNTTVKELDLSQNGISDDGAVAISDCLKYNNTLKVINLSENLISSKGMDELLYCIDHAIPLEYVDLSNNKSSPWSVYCAIIKYCSVSSLTLCGDERMMKYIKKITNSLQTNETLHSLTLCKIGRIGVQSIESILVDNTTLIELNVSWESNARISNQVKPNLSLESNARKTKTFNNLSSESNAGKVKIYDLSLENIARKIKILNKQVKPISDNYGRMIKVLCDDHYKFFSRSISLSDQNIDDDAVYLVTFGLYGYVAIKMLDLSHNSIDIHGMDRLSKCVIHTTSLEYVDLSENISSPWGVYCTIIRYCCVNSLALCGDEGMLEYVEEIRDGININTTLQSLTLCKIGKIGLQSIGNVLVDDTTFKLVRLNELNLSWGSSAKGTKLLYREFKLIDDRIVNVNILHDDHDDKSLSSINLSKKNIDDNAVYLIIFGLQNNTTLKELDVSHNYISKTGLNKLSECVKCTTSLEYIDLCGNIDLCENIDKQRKTYLCENKVSPWKAYCNIVRHCCINSLTLCRDEEMDNKCIYEIVESLQKNETLHSITLCNKEKFGMQLIKNVSDNNTVLKELNESCKSKKATIIHRKLMDDRLNRTKLNLNSYEGAVDVIIFYDGDHNCSSEAVNMSNKDINCDAIKLITFGLDNNTTVTKLDLSHNSIADDGAVIISNCLKHSNKLRELNLSGNLITSEGMSELLDCINCNHAVLLEYVDLSDNESSPWSVYCAIIRCCCVSSLTLCGNKGINKFVEKIMDNLQINATLQSLTLCASRSDAAIKDNMKKPQSSFVIYGKFNFNFLISSDEKATNRIVSIKVLLYNYDFECSPEVIKLSDRKIDDDMLCLISFGLHNNETVKKLDLSCNSIGVSGMNRLSECIKYIPSLEYIDLSKNHLSPWGVYCAAIKHCKVCALTCCGDEGMKEYDNQITDGLQRNTKLQLLTLCACKGKKGRYEDMIIKVNSADQLHNISTIDGKFCCTLTNGNGKITLNNDNRVLNIKILYDGDGECLPESLNLSNNHINDDTLCLLTFGLYSNTALWKLDLSHNSISSNGMDRLSELVSHGMPLKYVDLSGNDSSPWGVYCNVIRHCRVRRLTLCGNNGIKHYVMEIIESLKGNSMLHSLILCTSRNSAGRYEDMVLKASKMKSEDISIIDGKLSLLVNDREEVTLKNGNKIIDIKVVYDGDHKCLPGSIDLSNKDVSDDTLCLLTFGLYNNTKVQKLDLSHNDISANGMNGLLECIKHDTPLKYVDLSGNDPSPWGVYCAIIRHCCVNSLTLCGDSGIKHHVKKIMDGLQRNAVLQSLTLCTSRNNVGRYENMIIKASSPQRSQGISIIEGNLSVTENNNRLVKFKILYDGDRKCLPQSVALPNMDISDDTVYLITFGLYNNKIVRKLDLSCNNISISGMNRLTECVKYIPSLEYVDLSGNASSPWGVYCAIIKHCCVSNLMLCGEDGMNHYTKKIIDSLQENTTLQSLTVHKAGKIGIQSIKNILGTNTILKESSTSMKNVKIIHAKLSCARFDSTSLDSNSYEREVEINLLCCSDYEYSSEIIDF